jgi:O-antigen/teichoic acid export membrane protein
VYRYILNTFLARISSAALNFFIVLVIARHAGPAIKGEVTLLVTISWFFIFLSNILGGQALIYLIPRNKIELLVVPAYIWSIVVAILGFILLKSTHAIQINHVTSITILSLLYSFVTIHQTILLAKKQITNANLVQIVALLIQATGIILCFYILRINSAFAYIYASLAAYSFTAILSFFLIKRIVPFSNFLKDFTWSELKTSFRYGMLYQSVEVLQLLNLRYYFFHLGIQEGPAYLGIYSIGIAILEAVWLIPRSMSTVQYVATSNSQKIKEERERTVQLIKAGFILSGIVLFLISLIPPSVYIFAFGEGFRFTRHSMRFLYPGILIYNFTIVIGSFYLGIGKYKPLMITHTLGFITLAILSYFLLPIYVMTGAGLAATISFTIASLFLLIYFVRDNNVSPSKFWISKKDVQSFIHAVTRLRNIELNKPAAKT